MFKRLSRNNSQPLLKEQFIKFRGFPSPLHKSDVDLESFGKIKEWANSLLWKLFCALNN